MTTPKIDEAIAEVVADAVKSEAELVDAIQETAQQRVELAEETAAQVIAASETTLLMSKINSIEERLNTWPQSSAADFVALNTTMSQVLATLQEVKDLQNELMDLLTEQEEVEQEEVEPQPSIQPISPSTEAAKNSPQPEEKSASSAHEKPKARGIHLL